MSRSEPTALVLLDLSAAFDTIDHSTLLSCLSIWFGVGGSVLKWFTFYLTDHYQSIIVGSTLSDVCKLLFGVPQGSVLGPLLSSLYTTTLSLIISKHKGLKFHFYADGSQVYVHLSFEQLNTSITPVLKKMYWLPVEQHTMFKTATLVYKFLHTGFPKYFAPYFSSYSSSSNTRCSQRGGNFLVIPKFYPYVHKSVKYFGNSFAPAVWNALSDENHALPSLASFRKQLKTYQYTKAYPP